MNIVILDGAAAAREEFSYDCLERFGQVTYYPRTKPSEVVERAKDAEVILLNKVIIDREVLDNLPKLKLIQILATGYNVVDIDYARQKGIAVCNIPSYSTMSVVQLTIGLMIECCSQISTHDRSVKAGDWASCIDFCYSVRPIIELSGKTIGLIGYGDIASNVAKVCKALGMRVLGYRRTPTTTPYAEMVSLDEIYSEADIISLHCPATKDTIGMINSESIAKMKDKIILINTARGNLICEQDVANSLANGKIAYYATDVLASEPPAADNPIIHAPNSIVTPHIAWASYEARERLFAILVDNIQHYVHGNIINKVN